MIRNLARATVLLFAILIVMADADNRDQRVAEAERAAQLEYAQR